MRRKNRNIFGILCVAGALACAAIALRELSRRGEMSDMRGITGGVGITPRAATRVPAAAADIGENADGQVMLNGVDSATAAILMAIVLHNTGADPAELRFVSIKEVV